MTQKVSKFKRSARAFRIVVNLVLLLCTVVVVLQNTQSISIDFLWMEVNAPLALLLFLTGSVGSLITLFFLLFKS